jgi:hypothetical protein
VVATARHQVGEERTPRLSATRFLDVESRRSNHFSKGIVGDVENLIRNHSCLFFLLSDFFIHC